MKTDTGYILIDTLFPTKRDALEKELENAGCKPGNLQLIVLTHGDSDHAGNCAYLREKYDAQIAMHSDDSGMVERGDPSWNRKMPPDKISIPKEYLLHVSGGVRSYFDATRDSPLEAFEREASHHPVFHITTMEGLQK